MFMCLVRFSPVNILTPETHLELCQTSKMELFLTTFRKALFFTCLTGFWIPLYKLSKGRRSLKKQAKIKYKYEWMLKSDSFLIFCQGVGPENLFCNYLTRIHREEVGISFPSTFSCRLNGSRNSTNRFPKRNSWFNPRSSRTNPEK